MRLTYRHTLLASYLGYITQAIVINLSPLLFVTFQQSFGVSIERIALLISFNFIVQIATDYLASRLVDRIGLRVPVVLAHVVAVLGLVLLAVLPGPVAPYPALLIATLFLGVGGGLTEVLISPIVEALPGEEKAGAMSLLHSFYSWGLVCVVLLSTGFFALFGRTAWRFLPIMWALVPFVNIFLFAKVPLRPLVAEHERQRARTLFAQPIFWLLLLMMVCGGAAEQAMSQWASLFAEVGLGVPKAMGDLLGPCAFAAMMGLARVYYGFMGGKLRLRRAMGLSAALCVVGYLIAVFSPWPLLSLVGCALTGLAVGLMWPGSLSLSAAAFPLGGTAMFGIMALAGDLGCTVGPMLVGRVSGLVERGGLARAAAWFQGTGAEAGLKLGLLFSIAFPIVMIVAIAALGRRARPSTFYQRSSDESLDKLTDE